MKTRALVLVAASLSVVACRPPPPVSPAARSGQTVRCAVIAGMVTTGFFPAIARRFEEQTGHRVEIVAAGNKEAIAPAMQRGEADLITMHAGDAIINLVADGYAIDPEPWAKNDLVIIGPPDDPAGVRGLADAAEAVRRIVTTRSQLVVPHSMGAQEVLRGVLRGAGVTLDETTAPHAPEGPAVSIYAAERHAYTIVGRIPFSQGKIPAAGLTVLVQGAPRLRRPYVVAVANPGRFPDAHVEAAQALARFLRAPGTQQLIARFSSDSAGAAPFYPIAE